MLAIRRPRRLSPAWSVSLVSECSNPIAVRHCGLAKRYCGTVPQAALHVIASVVRAQRTPGRGRLTPCSPSLSLYSA